MGSWDPLQQHRWVLGKQPRPEQREQSRRGAAGYGAVGVGVLVVVASL